MPAQLLSYDVKKISPDPYTPLIKALIAEKWSPWIQSDEGKTYRLPNTTFVGAFGSRDAAKAAFDRAVAAASSSIGVKITVEKYIVATYTDATFNSDVTQ